MKKTGVIGLCIVSAYKGFACIQCNKSVQEGIFDSMFYVNIVSVFSSFIVLALIVVVLSVVSTKRRLAEPKETAVATNWIPLSAVAIVLGMGAGGFIDGIVFHQILQWHEMLTNKIPATSMVNKSVNMFWDGIFHAFTLLACLVGLYLFWKLLKRTDINRSGYLMAGGMTGGWGLFNLVEGSINHHLLKLHNVREYSMNNNLWNYGFLGFGILLLLLGLLLIYKGRKESS